MPIQTLINVEAILNHAQIYHKWVVTIKIMGGRLLFYQITANITPASTVASLSFRSDFWLKNHNFYPWDVSFSGGGTTSELALVAQA